jgi:serine/threonine protein phosphatase PrpC
MEPHVDLLARPARSPERPRPVCASHAATHIGRREDNQDTVLADDEARLYAVADGLGGRPGGAVASRLAVEELRRIVRRSSDVHDDDTVQLRIDLRRSKEENLLEHAVLSAHRAVMRNHDGELSEMATTLAALYVAGSSAVIAHVGDSRVYRLRAGALEALTRDHSLVNDLLDLGNTLSLAEQRSHSHVVMRALGVLRGAEPAMQLIPVRSDDLFLLCSDGLHGTLPDERLAELLSGTTPEAAAERLVAAAIAAGADDNVSAVVVRVT